jgi:adenine-specific DNA-methyltransferase
MLAAAMAKHEAFTYCPDSEIYWKQGKSSEKDFIFTTTSFLQVAFLDRLHECQRSVKVYHPWSLQNVPP